MSRVRWVCSWLALVVPFAVLAVAVAAMFGAAEAASDRRDAAEARRVAAAEACRAEVRASSSDTAFDGYAAVAASLGWCAVAAEVRA